MMRSLNQNLGISAEVLLKEPGAGFLEEMQGLEWSFVSFGLVGLILPSATLYLVGWVEPISGYVGFRFTQSNLHFVSSIR